MNKKTTRELINLFLEDWDCEAMQSFFRDAIPLIELYDVEESDDWLKDKVGEDDERNVRLIRTVYLVSRIAEFHAPRLCSLKIKYKDLWKKLELEVEMNKGDG